MAEKTVMLRVDSYSQDAFDLAITGLNSLAARRLHDIATKEILGSDPDQVRNELEDLSFDQQQALITAAQLYYYNIGGKNKINTIKHLRTLVLTRLGLKAAKDLVDFAIGEAFASQAVWLKKAA